MMDDMVDVILDLILEGTFGVAKSKRVPFPIRILSAGLILLFFLGIVGFLFWNGVRSKKGFLIALGILFLIGFSYWYPLKYEIGTGTKNRLSGICKHGLSPLSSRKDTGSLTMAGKCSIQYGWSFL